MCEMDHHQRIDECDCHNIADRQEQASGGSSAAFCGYRRGICSSWVAEVGSFLGLQMILSSLLIMVRCVLDKMYV